MHRTKYSGCYGSLLSPSYALRRIKETALVKISRNSMLLPQGAPELWIVSWPPPPKRIPVFASQPHLGNCLCLAFGQHRCRGSFVRPTAPWENLSPDSERPGQGTTLPGACS